MKITKGEIVRLIFGLTMLIFLIFFIPLYSWLPFALIFLLVIFVLIYDRIDNLLKSVSPITIIKILDAIAFVVANFIIFLLFEHYLQIDKKGFYIFLFVLSIIIVKTEWILQIINRTPSSTTNHLPKKIRYPFSKRILLNTLPIGLKQFFYNILYLSFPIFLIWLSLTGFAFLLGFIDVEIIQYSLEVITAISIGLGIFQYFLKRQEEKVFIKINLLIKRIDSIINTEISFEKYLEQLEMGNEKESLKKWIINRTDPKAYASDLLPYFVKQPEVRKFYKEILTKVQVPLIQLSINYADSNKKFKVLDSAAIYPEYSQYHEKLINSYKSFFGKENEDKIFINIQKSIDLQEFGNLTLSNINIIHELLADFININSRLELEKMINTGNSEDLDMNEPSSDAYRESLKRRIFKRIFRDILGYSKPSL